MHQVTWIKLGWKATLLGLLIGIAMTLQSSENLAFFTTNIGFQVLTLLITVAAYVIADTPDPLHWHVMRGLQWLCVLTLIMGLYPIILWAREGIVCNGLSNDQLAAARACYASARAQAPRVQNIAQFTNVIATYTMGCYQSQEILGAVNDICYNVIWDSGWASTIYAFQFISWFLMEGGILVLLVNLLLLLRTNAQLYTCDTSINCLMIVVMTELLIDRANSKPNDSRAQDQAEEFKNYVQVGMRLRALYEPIKKTERKGRNRNEGDYP